MKRVLAFGTFDIFHKGHESYLRQAAEFGRLYVIVARDRNVEILKGSPPKNPEKIRLNKISSLDFVHEARLGHLSDLMASILEVDPDIVCLGYDQDGLGLEDFIKNCRKKIRILRLKPYKPNLFKSSILKKQ